MALLDGRAHEVVSAQELQVMAVRQMADRPEDPDEASVEAVDLELGVRGVEPENVPV